MANDPNNKGVLFINKNKSKPTDPDYSGTINISGREFWINGWINTAKRGVRQGEDFVAFNIGQEKEVQQASTRPLPQQPNYNPPPPPQQPYDRQQPHSNDTRQYPPPNDQPDYGFPQ